MGNIFTRVFDGYLPLPPVDKATEAVEDRAQFVEEVSARRGRDRGPTYYIPFTTPRPYVLLSKKWSES